MSLLERKVVQTLYKIPPLQQISHNFLYKKALVEEKRSAKTERDRVLAQSRTSAIERNETVRQLQAQEANIQQRISQAVLTATKKKDNTTRLLQEALEASRKILNVIANILYQASEVFRRAIDAIVHFGTKQHKSIFAPSEAADIKSVMQKYGETTEIQKAVGDSYQKYFGIFQDNQYLK